MHSTKFCRAVLNDVFSWCRSYRAASRATSTTSAPSPSAMVRPMLSIINLGGTATIMSEFDPVKIWEVFGEEKITVTLAVPAMLQFMLLTYDKDTHDTSSLRWVMSGAAPVPVSLIETYAAMGIEIHQVYGLTETCGPACLISPDDALDRAGSTGKEFFFTRVRVVNEAGDDCGPDEPGEVLVKGPHIMVGYLNRDDATAESIVDGWLRTGDVAVMDADGFVYIMGRTDDVINVAGHRLSTGEMEEVVASHPAVAECCVVGAHDDLKGQVPIGLVLIKDGATIDHDELEEELVEMVQKVRKDKRQLKRG